VTIVRDSHTKTSKQTGN